ncbi:hypothetical protein AB0F46_17030 [Streptomyces sp. NPDC026665]
MIGYVLANQRAQQVHLGRHPIVASFLGRPWVVRGRSVVTYGDNQ